MDMSTIWPILKPILAGQIRTWLAGFGAILVHSGAIEQSDVASFTKMGTGIAIWALVAGWSWWQKDGQAKFIAVIAKMKPVAAPAATVGEAVKAATAAAKVAAVILTAVLFGALAMPAANAQTTANPFGLNAFANSPLIKALNSWITDDINEAERLSTAIPELQDPVGQACWKQFQAMGSIVKQHPLPLSLKQATDLESSRLLTMAIKNVCKNPQCTQMFTDLSNQVGAFAPIPTGLSFTAICSKIP